SALRRWNGTFLTRTSASDLERRFDGGVIVLHRAELQDLLLDHAGAAVVRLIREWGHRARGRSRRRRRTAFRGANGARPPGPDTLFRLHGLALCRSIRSRGIRVGRNLGLRETLWDDAR